MSRSIASSRSCHTGHIIIISMVMNYQHYSHYFSPNEICPIGISVRRFAFRVFSVRAQLSDSNIAINTEASSEKKEIHVRKQQGSHEECGSGKVRSSKRRNKKADGNPYSRYGTWFMRSSWWLNRPVAGCLRGDCSSAETTLHTQAPFPPQLA